jgi:hypothetical protein
LQRKSEGERERSKKKTKRPNVRRRGKGESQPKKNGEKKEKKIRDKGKGFRKFWTGQKNLRPPPKYVSAPKNFGDPGGSRVTQLWVIL